MTLDDEAKGIAVLFFIIFVVGVVVGMVFSIAIGAL